MSSPIYEIILKFCQNVWWSSHHHRPSNQTRPYLHFNRYARRYRPVPNMVTAVRIARSRITDLHGQFLGSSGGWGALMASGIDIRGLYSILLNWRKIETERRGWARQLSVYWFVSCSCLLLNMKNKSIKVRHANSIQGVKHVYRILPISNETSCLVQSAWRTFANWFSSANWILLIVLNTFNYFSYFCISTMFFLILE